MSLDIIVDIYAGDDSAPDFVKVRQAGIRAVIHKASESSSYHDPQYHTARKQALAAGLWWGAYHFGRGDASGKEQAKYFLDFVQPEKNELVALDFEKRKQHVPMTVAQAVEYVEYIYDQLARWPVFYGGGYLKDTLKSDKNATLANCPLWLAEYGPKAKVPANWPDYTIWQDAGDVQENSKNGVAGLRQCDRNLFNGDLGQLRQLWGY